VPSPVSKPIRLKFPKCFDSQRQYDEWRAAGGDKLTVRHPYCQDCTPEYQAAMKRVKRCVNRRFKFVVNNDDKD
jgi:hypothetical protein